LLLLDTIRATAAAHGEAKIINLSSYGYKFSRGLNFKEALCDENHFKGGRAYGDSKLSLIYFTRELARRYGNEHIIAHALNPGTVRTGLVRKEYVSASAYPMLRLSMRLPFFTIHPRKAAEAIHYLAESKTDSSLNGSYWDLKKPVKPKLPPDADNQAQLLWDASLNYVKMTD
jgi:NAD(P)-dependent dehydrogenase (short-subunit alcohol dehydrogenase family)